MHRRPVGKAIANLSPGSLAVVSRPMSIEEFRLYLSRSLQ
jgi:hypothetical protein